MADERKRPAKTETLTIRLDPKTRFILDFLSRYHGQTITTVIERAVTKAASEIDVAPNHLPRVGWQDLWDTSEAVRSIAVAQQPELFPTFEEERRVAFIREHWEFFYTNSNNDTVRRYSADVLWPRIDEFIQLHETERATDYWAAGRAMSLALHRAGLTPPTWPRATSKPAPPPELDEEIPF